MSSRRERLVQGVDARSRDRPARPRASCDVADVGLVLGTRHRRRRCGTGPARSGRAAGVRRRPRARGAAAARSACRAPSRPRPLLLALAPHDLAADGERGRCRRRPEPAVGEPAPDHRLEPCGPGARPRRGWSNVTGRAAVRRGGWSDAAGRGLGCRPAVAAGGSASGARRPGRRRLGRRRRPRVQPGRLAGAARLGGDGRGGGRAAWPVRRHRRASGLQARPGARGPAGPRPSPVAGGGRRRPGHRVRGSGAGGAVGRGCRRRRRGGGPATAPAGERPLQALDPLDEGGERSRRSPAG